jgi:hypothetical protein
MWASNFVFGSWSNSAQSKPELAPHLAHVVACHVLDELSCMDAARPTPSAGRCRVPRTPAIKMWTPEHPLPRPPSLSAPPGSPSHS